MNVDNQPLFRDNCEAKALRLDGKNVASTVFDNASSARKEDAAGNLMFVMGKVEFTI